MTDPTTPVTVALMLASYIPNAAAGMERATAALAQGLRQLGHRALIITTASPDHVDEDTLRLPQLEVNLPSGDEQLRGALLANEEEITGELAHIYHRYHVDIAVYADALWGLGRIAPRCGVRSVLAMHVVGHDEDLLPALHRADRVIAPSLTVVQQAHHRGYPSSDWPVVPNALLHDVAPPSPDCRERLRQRGMIGILARLGPEKNVPALLDAGRLVENPVSIVLADAGFEPTPGGQARERQRCAHAAAHMRCASVHDGLAWDTVPAWLANIAVVIVPSVRETFGLVALEAMSVGTPVVAFDVDNLGDLIGLGVEAGGVVVVRSSGEHGLWRAAEDLLADPIRYGQLSRAAYYRSRDYLPTTVAETFVKAVR